jgi:hypothetical protein
MARIEDEDGGALQVAERARRLGSWISIVVFALTFAALLGLSATQYWRPDNPLLAVLDRTWRISGFLAIALGSIPYLIRLGQLFAGKS